MKGIATFSRLGRLGRFANGAFQVAGTIGIARKNGLDPRFPLWRNYDGLNFERDLDIDCYKQFVNPLPLYDGPPLPHCPISWGYHDVRVSHGVDLEGHFQSQQYFDHCIDEVRFYMRMAGELPMRNICGLHYRAGDYGDAPSPQHPQGNSFHPRMNESYYGPAMALFPSDQKFLVFSDDIEGARKMFGDRVEYSEGRNYFEDFKLMKTCQPAGTLVKTLDGDVKIEELYEGDRVVSYSGAGQVHKAISKLIGRGDSMRAAPPGRAIESIGPRQFGGRLTVLQSDSGRISRYTPNHLSIVRFGDSLTNTQVVYLMRKGDQFRVGVTGPQSHHRGRKTQRAIGICDIRTRLNSAQADEAWILSTFRDRDEALLEEKYISAKFGIPEVSFDGWRTCGSPRLTRFWERFGSNVEGARRCLSYYDRRVEFPFCKRHERLNLLMEREVVIPACNVLNGMKVLDADIYLTRAGGKGECEEAWREVRVDHEPYCGAVYSMNVEVNRSYVGDGLVTHNCRHFIIANSSFSAFAAILGEAPDKQVVAPAPWFGGQYQGQLEEKDIYSKGWKVIDYRDGSVRTA